MSHKCRVAPNRESGVEKDNKTHCKQACRNHLGDRVSKDHNPAVADVSAHRAVGAGNCTAGQGKRCNPACKATD